MIKAKPDFHKKTFLKPFHKTAEFCSTCHKVSLPPALNHYKEYLDGQGHYLSYLQQRRLRPWQPVLLLSPSRQNQLRDCHMPLKPSGDFGSQGLRRLRRAKGHSHFFPGANTGLPFLLAREPRCGT